MLTDIQIKAEKPGDKPRKISDSGGLHLLVNPNGNKLWRYSYRFRGMQKTMAMGQYPHTSLADARGKRDAAKRLLQVGLDPSEERKKEKLLAHSDNSFKAVAEEWLAKREKEGASEKSISKWRWLLSLVYPDIGSTLISEVTPPVLLASLRRIEARECYESARRCRGTCGQVFRYGIATGRGGRDHSVDLRDALITPTVTHRAAIVDPPMVGRFLRDIDGYNGVITTRLAFRLAPYVFVRPQELRMAEWTEFNHEAEWRIEPGKMKMRRPHRIPLCRQALEIIAEVKALKLQSPFLFPNVRDRNKPMSENTILAAIRSLGYASDEMCGHGFRGMASTLLNEMSRWNPDAIERQLAHVEDDDSRKPYTYWAEFWNERREMMQVWADYLDDLRAGKAARGRQAA